ncbi:MAG: M12 family metallo-peptidase [Ignavibacteria bacterium]|nr:M12 family metallo-peptidase [Ignavibacteria bacterium]
MYNSKNKIIQAYAVWFLGIFIFTLVLSVHAGDEEIDSLFTPVTSMYSAPDDAAVGVAIPGSQQDVIINLVPLKSKSEAYGKVRIDFLDHSIMVRRTKFLAGLKESVTWIGKPENLDGSVVMSVCGNVLFGCIELKDEVYKIEPVRGTNTHRIFKLDPEKAAPVDDGGLVPPRDEFPAEMNQIAAIPAGKDDGSVFDVLALYTNGFAEAYPGDELVAQISYLAGVANTSYANSEVTLTARVVGLREVDYSDNGKMAGTLDDLTDGKGVFSKVAALRNQLGADLVVLLRVFKDDNDACGLGWQMLSLSNSFEKWAFSVVQVGMITQGNSISYCTDQTLAHEMGHNMGCDHDAAYGTNGVFKYSYGYCFYPYKSVMAYCTSAETRVSHFSNPNVSYDGIATGAEDANNAQSINKVKQTISQFRDSKCLGAMTVSSNSLLLNREGSSEVPVTVTVTGEYDYPVEGETLNAKVNAAGKKLISISPSSNTTDSNGQATFTITAGKKNGKAKITFESDCLKKSITTKVR